MRELLEAADFLGKARRRMRFGVFSRLPVQLLRLEWTGLALECEWLMRPADPWDCDLPRRLAEEHQTLQALRDAMSLRDMIFDAFPAVTSAELRMYGAADGCGHELLMTGTVNRANEIMRRVASVAMRAKLCGFRFTLAEGVLKSMNSVSLGCS